MNLSALVDEPFRQHPPAPLAAKALRLPPRRTFKLDNGLRIVAVSDHRAPLVTMRLAFFTGDSYDPPNLPGLSDVVTTMLSEGTESRSSREIAEDVARLGAHLTAGASSDYVAIAGSALAEYRRDILELMSDIALHPTFPEDELELVRQNTLQNLIAQRGQASFLANERMARIMYGDHPYSVISPTPESIGAMSRDQLISHHRSTFVPNNAVLLALGSMDTAEVADLARRYLGDWRPLPVEKKTFPAPPERRQQEISVVDRPGSQQSNIVIANSGISRGNPDYFPMLLMHTILGANASSRLFMNLREDKGYTYGAYSILDARLDRGTFRATAEVRTPVTGDSLDQFLYEFSRIRDEAAGERELNEAQTYLTGIFPIRLETQDGLIEHLLNMEIFRLPEDYLETYSASVRAVTAAEVQRVASEYVRPDIAAVVIVGDENSILQQVRRFSNCIETYDSMGTLKRTTMEKLSNREAGSSATVPDKIIGKWLLEIRAPGMGTIPVTLVLEEEGGEFSGSVQSSMGAGELSEIKVDQETFRATISVNLAGRSFSGKIDGTVHGAEMDGTIKVNLPVAPVKFIGKKESAG